MDFFEGLMNHPVIAAVDTSTDLIDCPCEIVFVLKGSIADLEDCIQRIKNLNKQVYVHVDLLKGLKADESGLAFIKKMSPDGIITTHSRLVSEAKKLGLFAIQRLFLLDRKNLNSGIRSVLKSQPDAIEVLPGVVHKATKEIIEKTNIPVISGGLIIDKEDVIGSLKVGVIGVSTSQKALWHV